MSCCIAKRQAKLLGVRLIDQATGRDVTIGQPTPSGYTVLRVDRGIFTTTALISVGGAPARQVKLPVTSNHPSFLGQRVAFIPS